MARACNEATNTDNTMSSTGVTTADPSRIKALEAEVEEPKWATEILLAASSFFARELDRRLPW